MGEVQKGNRIRPILDLGEVMPTYDFECADCAHRGEVFMKMDDYKDVVKCPQCSGQYKRSWKNTPAIKTIVRMEDVWKKQGVLDPEDPEYRKVNCQRVRAMREKAIKARDRKLNKADIKKGRTKDFKPTRKPGDFVSKPDLDKLPDVAKDRVNLDEIAKEND